MSVPAPVGAGTNDERDEGGEGHSPLEERCRIPRACIPPNHEIFTSQEMSADKSRFALRIVLYPVHDASPGRVKNRAAKKRSYRLHSKGFAGVGRRAAGPLQGRATLGQSQRQPAPAPTTSATRAATAIAPFRSVAASSARAYQRITRSFTSKRWPQFGPVLRAHPVRGGDRRIPIKREIPAGFSGARTSRSRPGRAGARRRPATPRRAAAARPAPRRSAPPPAARSG
jgi:hypothetical protein